MQLVKSPESGINDALHFEGEEDLRIAQAIFRAEAIEYVRAERRINELYKNIGAKASEQTVVPIVSQRQMRQNDPAIRLTKSTLDLPQAEEVDGLIFGLGSPIEEIINYIREGDVDSAELEREHVADIVEVLRRHADSGALNLKEEDLWRAIDDIEKIYEPIGGLDNFPGGPNPDAPHNIGPPPDNAA